MNLITASHVLHARNPNLRDMNLNTASDLAAMQTPVQNTQQTMMGKAIWAFKVWRRSMNAAEFYPLQEK